MAKKDGSVLISCNFFLIVIMMTAYLMYLGDISPSIADDSMI